MKNLFMIAIALVTLNATAQERKSDAQKENVKERMEMRKSLTPQERADLQTKKMTLKLDLTASQQAEVNKMFLQDANTRKIKMEQYKAKKQAATAEKPSKEDYLKMQNERLDHQIEMMKKMKAILNADQYQKFEKMQEEKQGRGGKKYQMRKRKK